MDKCTFTLNSDSSSTELTCDDVVQYFSEQFEIKNNERKYRLILVTPEKRDGFYAIKFYVERCEFPDSGAPSGAVSGAVPCNWETYGGTQKIMGTVP